MIVPAVIDQLARMADGYERAAGDPVPADERPATDAAALLAKLRQLVTDDDVQLVVAPFSAPLLPSLASGGLSGDLDRQQDLGEAIVAEHLGHEPAASTVRPPQGALDEPSLQWLADRGATTVLAQADTVDRPAQPNDFTLLPTANVTTEGGTTLDLVLPDPGVQGLLGDPLLLGDPVRASQAVLGELATIWREQPVPGPQLDGTETVRGVALSLPASLPAGVWAPLLRRLTRAPFLRPTHASSFAERVHPVQEGAVITPSLERFPREYVDDIREQRRNVGAYRSMLDDRPSPLPARLERNLLFAEAGEYVRDPLAGRGWYDQVSDATGAIFQGVLPDVQQEFLLTSSEGSIPLRMGDPGPTPLTVQVVLRSASFEFPDGVQQTITLEGPDEIVTIDVVAKAGGPQTIRVKTRAPSGRDLGEDQNLAVRTTAVNSVALWITIGAGVVLVLLWSRRLVRRPRLTRSRAGGGHPPTPRRLRAEHGAHDGRHDPVAPDRLRAHRRADRGPRRDDRPARQRLHAGQHHAQHRLRADPRGHPDLGLRAGVRRPPAHGTGATPRSTWAAVSSPWRWWCCLPWRSLGIVFAPQIMRLYLVASEAADREAQIELGVFLLRWFMPQVVFYGIGAIAGGLLERRAPLRRADVRADPQQPRRDRSVRRLRDAACRRRAVGRRHHVAGEDGARRRHDPGRRRDDGQRSGRRCAASDSGGASPADGAIPASAASCGSRVGCSSTSPRTRPRTSRSSCSPAVYGVARFQIYATAFIIFLLPHSIFAVSIFTALLPAMAERWGDGDIDGVRERFSLGLGTRWSS